METYKKAALEVNALAKQMNSFDDSHVELIGRLIELADELANGPTSDAVALKAELVVDFQAEGLHDWAERLKKIEW